MSDTNNNNEFLVTDAAGLPPEDRTCVICNKEGSLFGWQEEHYYQNEESFSDTLLWLCDGHQKEVREHFLGYIKNMRSLYKNNPIALGEESYTYRVSEINARNQRAQLIEDEIKMRVRALRERRYERMFEDDDEESMQARKQMWEDDVKQLTKYLEQLTGVNFSERMKQLSRTERKKLQ